MLSVAQEPARCDEGTVRDKKKPARRDPEKRRQQNIQAQRKYREKLRDRLGKLEALASLASQSQTHAVVSTKAAFKKTEKVPGSSRPAMFILTPPIDASQMPTSSAQPIARKPYSPWDAFPAAPFVTTPLAPPGEVQHSSPETDEASTSPDSSTWDSSTSIDLSFLVPKARSKPESPHYAVSIDCGWSNAAHSHLVARCTDSLNRGEFKTLTFGPTLTSGADPYANHLRLDAVCTLAAIATLGTYIGISEEVLCTDDAISHFYRSGATSIEGDKTVDTVQQIFKTLKPDLRPAREQIAFAHHPYIDILPFPTLRKNLIIEQNGLNEDEFFEDLLGGLVCWGGSGVGSKDRRVATGLVSTGSPWDVRSWEARGWFAKKYWHLLGGEEGELIRQSDWYRSVRGEEPLQVEVLCC